MISVHTQLEAGNDPTVQKRLDQIEADATMREKHWHVHTLAEALHHRPINEITSAEILHLLKKVEHSGRHETAKKLSGTLSAIFRLAIVTLRADNDPTQAVKGACCQSR